MPCPLTELKFVIVSTGRNCERFIQDWHASLEQQTYSNWTCRVALDPGNDASFNALLKLSEQDKRITQFEANCQRKGCLNNMFDLIHGIEDPDSVIVTLDLDDMLKPDALSRVAKEYLSGAWMTYGSYEVTDGRTNVFCRSIPEDVWKMNSHRTTAWRASHLRTFRTWLFKLIKPQSLQFENGAWYMRATDRAFMYPMLELCGSSTKARFIPEILYTYRVYGQQSIENDVEQKCLKHIISVQKKYSKLP